MDRAQKWDLSAIRKCLSMAALASGLIFLAGPRGYAETEEQCHRRIAHAEHELHEAIERHGRESRKAEHERRELHEARERCWREHHRWWDEHEHRWRTEHDWDDRDHYRDFR